MGHVLYTSAVAGVREEVILDVESLEESDPMRRAVYAFARKLTLTPAAVTREDVRGLREHMKEREIVELVLAICRYNTMNRLADGLGVPLESTNIFAVPRKDPGTDEADDPGQAVSAAGASGSAGRSRAR